MEWLLKAAQARKLDRVAAAYAVAGWLLVQGASILLPTFDAPVWALRVIIIVVLAGFPLALTVAWFLAPRTAVSASSPDVTRTHKGLAAVLGIVALVSLGEFLYILWRTPGHEATQEVSAPEMSIAVLPFANMSGDPGKQYFGDGIADELISELSRVPSLRVAARTSSFAFQGKSADIKSIAKTLNVRNILDGSVQTSANHIRIEAALVNAADGFSIWSERYDRDLTDILALQDDIAGAVTRALKAKLLGGQFAPRNGQSIDPEAYKLYLQTKPLVYRGNLGDLMEAVALLKKVTVLEPRYANGFASLGSVYRTLADRYNKAEFLAPGEIAGRQAISLDPKNLPALASLAQLLLDKWQWQEALKIFAKAQDINPNSADVLHLRSIIAFTFNFPKEDIAAELKASQLDPLRPAIKYGLALSYWNEKQYDAAAKAIQEVLKIRQGKFQDIDERCAIEASRGNLAEARRLAQEISSYYAGDPQASTNCPFEIAMAERNLPLARKIADAAAADALQNGGAFTSIGDCYRRIGDLKSAMTWYERAYTARDSLLLGVPFEKYQSPALLSYPPWKALWARLPIRDWEAARVEAGKILGVAN